MSDTRATPERLNAFCDAVFAVLITVLVLDLRSPDAPTFRALLLRWPTWLSYTVSHAFIAIVWVNHHYYRPPGWRSANWRRSQSPLCRGVFPGEPDLHIPYQGAH